MTTVNMLKAKSTLSRLVELVESGAEEEIIIARAGKPAARLVPLAAAARPKRRLGLLKGQFATYSQEEFDSVNAEVAKMFFGKMVLGAA